MKKFAVVFPGQGSQSVGMLADIYNDSAVVKDTFAEASDVLGYDVWDIASNGPKEKIDSTEYTQPILLAASVAVWRHWQYISDARPSIVAGHSLGEYSALVAAEALDFKQALPLVRTRAKLMQAAVPEGSGAMVAILGLADEQVESACAEASEGEPLAPANYNAPGQVVVAGSKDAIARVVNVAKEMGAKRALVLPMSVPSHSIMLQDAAELFKEYLNQCDWKKPKVKVIHNYNVSPAATPDEIVDVLYKQLFSPVKWVGTIENITKEVDCVFELGPGKVLTGLNKRISKYATYLSADSNEQIKAMMETLNDGQ